MGRLLRIVSIFLVLLCSFAGQTSAQCTWTASTAYPIPVLDNPTAAVGNNLYSFSGVSNNGLPTSSYKFDGTTWTAIAPLPAALEFASATSDGTNIFIIGGSDDGGTTVTTTYRYNVASNTYTTLAPCPSATWSHAAVLLNGKIYKIGGIGAAPSTAVNIYDIAANTWTTGAPHPTAAGFLAAVALNGFVYTAGGIDAAGSNKTYRYDPAANTWNDAAIADLPATRWGAAYTVYRNAFVMAGGYAGGDATASISATVISWDPGTNTWTPLANLVGGRARFTGAILNDDFYVVGGRSSGSSGFVGTTEVQKLTCPPLVACTGTPAPGNTFATSTVVCPNTTVTLSPQNNTPGTGVTYLWETSPTLTGTYTPVAGGTNNTVSVTPTVTAYYRVSVSCGAATTASTPVLVTVTPCTCITPDLAAVCEGTIQKLQVSGSGTPGTVNSASGPISIPVPDASAAGVTTTLPATLPAGATITSITVNLNLTHTWDSDMSINLVSPNGKILNLLNGVGGSGDNFVNTNIALVNAPTAIPVITTGVAPFTGTYRYQGAANAGPTGFTSNVTTFENFATPAVAGGAQNWRLALRDLAGGDLGILTSWSITVNYTVLPTAIWTGGTFFTDPAATVPYVAGTEANTVYVQPATTTTYTATIASGSCAGANLVTVNVLPRPVVTVNPTTGCGPLTITASGAATYSWTPGTGLNTTTGATVTANPSANTVYTVTGTGTNGCAAVPVSVTVNAAPTAAVISTVAGSTFQVQEGFNTFPPSGWAFQNLSNPLATTPPFNNWLQGDPLLFPAFNGAPNSYALGNFQATTGSGTISNWLFSPVVNIKNGDIVSFYTRTTTNAQFPDRLEVRLSTNGTSVNAGTTSNSVGDFTTLLFSVNPNLVSGPGTGTGTSGYPDNWTRLTGTVSGITGTVTGRIGLRHFVTNGGPQGANSDNIGIDQFEYATPSSVNCANVVTNIKVDITGGVGPYTVVFSNGTTSTTITNYTSGSNIQVSPAATTTYTIVSVTGANGCVGTGNSGSATITITPAPAITTPPASSSVCVGNNATFTVASTPAVGNTFQWQVSTDGGTTYTNVTNDATYSGATTATLTVTAVTSAMNSYKYRVIVTGACPSAVTSAEATLTVNSAAVITTQPVATSVCAAPSTTGASTTFTVAATGGGLTYQWQVSTDGGTTFTNVTNGGSYAGATTATLTVSNASTAFNNYIYRVLVTTGGCTAVTSNNATLTIKPATVVVVNASPYTSLYPGLTTTLTAAVSPSTATSYQWFRNGVAVPGALTNTLAGIGVDALGSYYVAVTDANGCGGISNTVVIKDSSNTTLFIYPNANNGKFNVRLFSDINMSNGLNPRTLNVYDAKGSRVYSKVFSVFGAYTNMPVDISNLGSGIYIVEVLTNNGERLKTGRVSVL